MTTANPTATATTTTQFTVVVAVEMVMFGEMGTDTYFKYSVFICNICLLSSGSGVGNGVGINVVLKIEVCCMVMVGDPNWGWV